ncbi:hypothetical protein ALI22I_25260 [Saccharothrix sp. ALI-22-I]|uniref:hypothetical protein n=1 Tax=Saccharothrix sp. ALI-22-I TaxID=1933778 RepID=UPI00097C35B7|nr:hypothetical protein [Saccharothrix sp. ALI-22-I]ONI86053.1 hypothetical protein ALI22I_25260 [Saccharothrix sp. ALI-22-I]
MAVPRSPVRWALVLLVVGLAGVAAAVALSWPGTSAEVQRVAATVVTPASCGGADAYDRVELTIGDQTHTAKLDGCGHQQNEVVEVVVPADTSGEFTVQAAANTPEGMPFDARLTALLMCLSGLAGGLYAYLLTRRAQPTASAEAA